MGYGLSPISRIIGAQPRLEEFLVFFHFLHVITERHEAVTQMNVFDGGVIRHRELDRGEIPDAFDAEPGDMIRHFLGVCARDGNHGDIHLVLADELREMSDWKARSTRKGITTECRIQQDCKASSG